MFFIRTNQTKSCSKRKSKNTNFHLRLIIFIIIHLNRLTIIQYTLFLTKYQTWQKSIRNRFKYWQSSKWKKKSDIYFSVFCSIVYLKNGTIQQFLDLFGLLCICVLKLCECMRINRESFLVCAGRSPTKLNLNFDSITFTTCFFKFLTIGFLAFFPPVNPTIALIHSDSDICCTLGHAKNRNEHFCCYVLLF